MTCEQYKALCVEIGHRELSMTESAAMAKHFRLCLECRRFHKAYRDKVDAAFERERDAIEKLRPYWEKPGTTRAQALAAYLADHPDELAMYEALKADRK
jgi:hypothetical protein